VRAAFGVVMLACGWLLVTLSGLCSANFVTMAGIRDWRDLWTVEGFQNAVLFLVIFCTIPIGGVIFMAIATRRAVRARRASHRRPTPSR
jgi:hypothetical protein